SSAQGAGVGFEDGPPFACGPIALARSTPPTILSPAVGCYPGAYFRFGPNTSTKAGPRDRLADPWIDRAAQPCLGAPFGRPIGCPNTLFGGLNRDWHYKFAKEIGAFAQICRYSSITPIAFGENPVCRTQTGRDDGPGKAIPVGLTVCALDRHGDSGNCA